MAVLADQHGGPPPGAGLPRARHTGGVAADELSAGAAADEHGAAGGAGATESVPSRHESLGTDPAAPRWRLVARRARIMHRRKSLADDEGRVEHAFGGTDNHGAAADP